MLFQRLEIDRVGCSKHLLVGIKRQDTRKNNELCSKLTFKIVETLNVCRGALSCANIITQSLFSRSRDEQILHLTSFKIAQIFKTSKFSKYLTASSSSTDLHKKGSAFPPILPKLTIL